MEDGIISLNGTPCWVYISEKRTMAGELQVGYSQTLQGMLADTREDILLYYRQYSTLTDGLGHKLLFEKLAPESLLCTIWSVNPEMRDLHEEFIIYRPKGP